MSILKDILFKPFNNRIAQEILEWNIATSLYLMGVGAGADVSASGEKSIFSLIKKKLPDPYCFFDVGANQGQFLKLLLASFMETNFTIHCFEPGIETYKILLQNQQSSPQIKFNNCGIGSEQGNAILHYDQPGSGIASLTKRRLDHFNIDFDKSESVQLETIDGYCLKNSIDHIHLLKIDIEGHELDALAGASQMIENKAIDIITFEFGGCNIDTRSFLQDFWYFFVAAKMDIFRITPTGYLFQIKSYREIYEQFRTTNFIAVSQNLKKK
jgi:FkbM family methyltransferase